MQFALISADADAIYCLTAMRYVAKATRYTLRRDMHLRCTIAKPTPNHSPKHKASDQRLSGSERVKRQGSEAWQTID